MHAWPEERMWRQTGQLESEQLWAVGTQASWGALRVNKEPAIAQLPVGSTHAGVGVHLSVTLAGDQPVGERGGGWMDTQGQHPPALWFCSCLCTRRTASFICIQRSTKGKGAPHCTDFCYSAVCYNVIGQITFPQRQWDSNANQINLDWLRPVMS